MVINGGTAATGLAGMRKQYSHDRAAFLAANRWVKPNLQDYDTKKLNVAVHVSAVCKAWHSLHHCSLSLPFSFCLHVFNYYPRNGSVRRFCERRSASPTNRKTRWPRCARWR